MGRGKRKASGVKATTKVCETKELSKTIILRYGQRPPADYAGRAIWPNGTAKQYKNGLLHSKDDQPSIISHLGAEQEWHEKGLRHRESDKPAVISDNGRFLKWYTKGQLHRGGDLPAYIRQKRAEWYNQDKLHRLYGPAVLVLAGDHPSQIKEEYWIDGIKLSKKRMGAKSESYLCRERGNMV